MLLHWMVVFHHDVMSDIDVHGIGYNSSLSMLLAKSIGQYYKSPYSGFL